MNVVTCPRCESALNVPPGVAAGTSVRCPEPWCRDVFRLGGRERTQRAHAAHAAQVDPGEPVRVMLAAPYGVASLCPFPGAEHLGRVRLQPGCFSRWLRVTAAAGNMPVELLDEHDFGRRFGTVADGALSLWEDPDGLYAAIGPPGPSPPGRPALSVGFTPTATRPGRDQTGPLTDVTEAVLGEVSFVDVGNFPGTGDPLAVARSNAAANVRRSAHRRYAPCI